MPSSRKKAIIRKFSRDWAAGYLSSDEFVQGSAVEMLGLDGKVTAISLEQIKWVCFVRDFSSGDAANPERLLRKTFAGRPRTAGLFVRLRLNDGDLIEGLAANDLSLISSNGVALTPPDIRGNTQRMWIPAAAVSELEIVAVIGSAKPRPANVPPDDAQERLF
jgi:hypothetical protein